MKKRWAVCVVLGLCGALPVPAALGAQGRDPNAAQASAERRDGNPRGRAYFTDVALVNQHGEKLRFYSDLLMGKLVVINSFYTSCTDSCPLIMGSMARLQDALGDRFGREVFFLSLTSDPAHDTPPRLKEYAKRFQARPGWNLLTGTRENVLFALGRIGQRVASKEDHLNLLILGNERTEHWKKAFAMTPTPSLLLMVEGLMTDGKPTAGDTSPDRATAPR
ncbi:MAG TPA: SCO family protein [Candidatus Methylomirabilis sp.]|nr:SCO family protein [Candidatus Methylomirabilis sp.]